MFKNYVTIALLLACMPGSAVATDLKVPAKAIPHDGGYVMLDGERYPIRAGPDDSAD